MSSIALRSFESRSRSALKSGLFILKTYTCQRHPSRPRPASRDSGYSTNINDERHVSPSSSNCSEVYQSTAKSELTYQSVSSSRCPSESELGRGTRSSSRIGPRDEPSTRREPGATPNVNRNQNDSNTRASKHEKRGRYVFHTPAFVWC